MWKIRVNIFECFTKSLSRAFCKVLLELRHGRGRPLKPVKPAGAFSHFTVLSEEEQSSPRGKGYSTDGHDFLVDADERT